MKWSMLVYVICGICAAVYLILQFPIFGKSPSGERLKRIKNSPHYRDGSFQNLSPTPQLTNGATMPGLIFDMLFGKKVDNLYPKSHLPHVLSDLMQLPDSSLVWLGHSTYLFKLGEKVFMVDPVLQNASPIPGFMYPFPGSNPYKVTDFPEIDVLIITHDHYDHLDYNTIKALKPKVKEVICGLGVGEHLEHWGFDASVIHEMDWGDELLLSPHHRIVATPARHFSGRALRRNQTLWCSYVLITPHFRLFMGGDSGYDTHFKNIGQAYGPFDLAVLENGQYNLSWKHIHTLPEELGTVKNDLNAYAVLPVHSGKFALAAHSWDEPLRLSEKYCPDRLVTPKIGEVVHLNDSTQRFDRWWELPNITPDK